MCSSNREVILNSRILSNHFVELCRDYLLPYTEHNLWANQKKLELNYTLIFFLVQTQRLIFEKKIDAQTFKNEILKIKALNILHVETLWYLDLFKLIPLNEFIQFHEDGDNEDVIQHITKQVFENLLDCKTKSSEVRKRLLQCFFKTALGRLKHHSTSGKISLVHQLISFIVLNLKQFYGCVENHDVERYVDISHLTEFFNTSELDSELIEKFLQQILEGLLESSKEGIKSVFKKQEKVKSTVKCQKISSFFAMMSNYCSLGFFIKEIQIMLLKTSRKINWDHMLCLITFVGIHYEDGWRDLKVMTDFIIKESFHKLDPELLSHAFLVARQGCFEKLNKSFPSYLQWFCSTFSPESRKPINSRYRCNFFFKFLTDILPFESSYYLKVHLNRPPWVPPDCHLVLHDYIELVKVHLNELNVSVELGICENTTNKSAAVFDVENVINHFQRTNDILSSVFQASLFCKEYYEKKFLVELLSKFEGKKSVRHKFILKLHSLGKIPNSMFKIYKGLEKKNK